ncbi:YcxB family protein [Paraclostridium bifermentans]|uniref:YcxB family protein n=1 Tax=Paraclostridium bifermentans TaxID=1490 RepID=UPI00189783C3|nr:YcxB family protein [Paraclostridium bifermentans]
MDTIFENHYILNKKLLVETCKPLVRLWFKIYTAVFTILSLFFAIFSYIVGLSTGYQIAFLCLACTFMLLRFQMYKVWGKRLFEQQMALNNDKPLSKSVYIWDDKIQVVSANGARTDIFYENIVKTYETEHFLMLNSENRVSLAIRKDGFTKGTYNDFKKFLFNKSQVKVL